MGHGKSNLERENGKRDREKKEYGKETKKQQPETEAE